MTIVQDFAKHKNLWQMCWCTLRKFKDANNHSCSVASYFFCCLHQTQTANNWMKITTFWSGVGRPGLCAWGSEPIVWLPHPADSGTGFGSGETRSCRRRRTRVDCTLLAHWLARWDPGTCSIFMAAKRNGSKSKECRRATLGLASTCRVRGTAPLAKLLGCAVEIVVRATHCWMVSLKASTSTEVIQIYRLQLFDIVLEIYHSNWSSNN